MTIEFLTKFEDKLGQRIASCFRVFWDEIQKRCAFGFGLLSSLSLGIYDVKIPPQGKLGLINGSTVAQSKHCIRNDQESLKDRRICHDAVRGSMAHRILRYEGLKAV